jgi:hypothetical protein
MYARWEQVMYNDNIYFMTAFRKGGWMILWERNNESLSAYPDLNVHKVHVLICHTMYNKYVQILCIIKEKHKRFNWKESD